MCCLSLFGWLAGARARAAVAPYPLAVGEQVLRIPAGAFRLAGRSTSFIEVIRFAAANHLCVDLDYVSEQGRRGTRTIEPYSLRRTQESNVLLHAVRSQDRLYRTYRVDRIRGARITQQTFAPSYDDVPGAAHRVGGIRVDDLADDEPVKQHAYGSQMLLDRGLGEARQKAFDIARDMHGLHVRQIVHAALGAEFRKLARRVVVGAPRVLVADIRGEEI